MNNHELIQHYLETYEIESIFNEPLMPHLSLFHFDRGDIICSQGESSNYLYILVKGKIKVYTTSVEGKTLILSFKSPLEVLGDIEYVQEIDFINTVEAVSSVSLIGVQYRFLKKYVQNYPPFLHFLLEKITRKFYLKSNSLSFNLLYPVEVRLASYLLSVAYDENDSLLNKEISTTSLMDIANLIGTSYRHLNRVIQHFCSNGLLERKKGIIIIKDKGGLKSFAESNIYE